MKAPSITTVKTTLFVLFVVALVCAPFILLGEEYVLPLLQSREERVGGLIAVCVVLLAADAVAPVPATLVLMFLAAKAGRLAGIVGGTVGLSAGVLAAAWIGRAAVGRVAPKFIPEAEIARLRDSLQRRLMVTLACLRSVPVLAETSVIVAAATGVPVKRIFLATLLPNFLMAVIYSLAADDSWQTACVTFLATLFVSFILWRWLGREPARSPAN